MAAGAAAVERPVRRAADLVAALQPDEHQVVALGPEVDLVDLVDDDREVRAVAGRQAEVRRLVAPRLDRQLDAGGPGEVRRPGADGDRRRPGPRCGRDRCRRRLTALALDRDRAAPGCPGRAGSRVAARRLEEAGRGPRRVGVARLRLVRPDARGRRVTAPGTSAGDLGRRRRPGLGIPSRCWIATLARIGAGERLRASRAGTRSGRTRGRRPRHELRPSSGNTGTTARRAASSLSRS